MTALNPQATNVVSCVTCGWKRIIDPSRFYRGGHTHPTNLYECHEMLTYEQASALPPEVYLLGEPEAWTGERTQEQVDALAELYELEGSNVDAALVAAAAP